MDIEELNSFREMVEGMPEELRAEFMGAIHNKALEIYRTPELRKRAMDCAIEEGGSEAVANLQRAFDAYDIDKQVRSILSNLKGMLSKYEDNDDPMHANDRLQLLRTISNVYGMGMLSLNDNIAKFNKGVQNDGNS